MVFLITPKPSFGAIIGKAIGKGLANCSKQYIEKKQKQLEEQKIAAALQQILPSEHKDKAQGMAQLPEHLQQITFEEFIRNDGCRDHKMEFAYKQRLLEKLETKPRLKEIKQNQSSYIIKPSKKADPHFSNNFLIALICIMAILCIYFFKTIQKIKSERRL